MTTQVRPRPRIVAAVDGSMAARHAVLWAADEAHRRSGELVVTHVDFSRPDAVGLAADVYGSEEILAASAAAASTRAPDVPVATLLLHGGITDELVKLSGSVSMLVLGVDPSRPRSAHGALGPIEDRVMVHARCPVVAVHEPKRGVGNGRADIVVGWVATDSGRRALRAAAEEADVRHSSLTVVSVFPVNGSPTTREQPAESVERTLSEALVTIEREFPDIFLNVVQERGDVVYILKCQAQAAELLVVGCPIAEDRWSIRTGPVVGALMREAPCPVMLVGRMAAELSRANPDLDVVEASMLPVSSPDLGRSR